MNPEPRERIDDLVGRYLAGQERPADADRILAGVNERLAKGGETSKVPHHRISTRRLALVAASLLLAVAAGVLLAPPRGRVQADPIRLVNEARQTLARSDVDRAYRVEIKLAPGTAERSPFLAALAGFDCRLWARSDRFRVEANKAERRWSIGQSDQGGVWVATSGQLGLSFGREELPEPLAEALDLLHFDLDGLLARLADEYELQSQQEDHQSPSGSTVSRIRATLRGDARPRRFRDMTVEIDDDSKLVRAVTLTRARNDRVLADVTFRLDRIESQADDSYTLASRLEHSATVLGDDRVVRRRREFVRFLGSLLVHGEPLHESDN